MKFKTGNILLTGATGVLGANVLKQILKETGSSVTCLIRAESKEAGRKRLETFLRAYDPVGQLKGEFERRVHVLVGDVTGANFGLNETDYQALIDWTDVTLHVAASTNLFSPWDKIEPVNVGGTKNVISFALKTRQKYLCQVSTYTVMGDKTFDPSVRFTERDLDIGQGFKHMTYQHSKFLAEQLVREAAKDGLTWNIFRPGQIFGEAETGLYPQGQTNVSGLFYDIFKTVIETGVALQSDTHFDVVPVDYVARGIVHLGLKRDSHFETYHLTNPDIKKYHQIIQLLRDAGYRIRFVSIEEYKKMLFAGSLEYQGQKYTSGTTFAFRWWFRKEQFDFRHSAITDCSYTQSILEKAGIYCAKINSKLMGAYIKRCVDDGYLPSIPASALPRISQNQTFVEGVSL